MPDFFLQREPDGVAILTWDTPEKSINTLAEQGVIELEACLDEALSDPQITGIILTSAKRSFANGLDLPALFQRQADGPAAILAFTTKMQRLLRKIEQTEASPNARKPIIAALNGSTLGVGLELALACHRIIATANPKAKIGLPEIKLGLIPAAGGTTRLIRKLGLEVAAPLLLDGQLQSPQNAHAIGLIEEVVTEDQLIECAKAWLLSARETDLSKPWEHSDPAADMHRFAQISAMAQAKSHAAAPAIPALLSTIYEGALVDFDTALTLEARQFAALATTPSSQAILRTMVIHKEALEQGVKRPALPDQKVRKLGVIGAGMMGAGIAYVSAKAGIELILIDAQLEAAERGKAYSEKLLERAVTQHHITPAQKEVVLSRIRPSTDYAELAGCDLIVEAVFEDPLVKAEVIAKIEAAVGVDCILATNTSTLPIAELATATRDPARFIGIHFFSPVDKMQLVEVIRGQASGDRAVAKALDYVRQIGKTPIVVNDARYFYANRCVLPYINEGIRMLAEGVEPALIENAARMLGMPVGPLQLVDEISIELAAKIATATRAALGETYPDDAVDAVIFAMLDLGRGGRKAKAGFYAYDGAGKREGLWRGLRARYPVALRQPPLDEVQNRLMLAQVLEAVRAFEEDVLTDIREGDVGAVLGWGFAPWSGGPFSWLDLITLPQAVAICDELTRAHGLRFATPPLLRAMATRGERFYP